MGSVAKNKEKCFMNFHARLKLRSAVVFFFNLTDYIIYINFL